MTEPELLIQRFLDHDLTPEERVVFLQTVDADSALRRRWLNLEMVIAEAEDLAQEAFLTAFKALSTFRADSKFSTWLYRIATNKCKDWLRVKRPGMGQQDVDIDETLDIHIAEEQTPERLLSQRQVGQELEQAIQRLPPLYREAFVLKHIEGLSYEEMEAILGVNSDTLKMRVYKGRLQLSRELASLNPAQ